MTVPYRAFYYVLPANKCAVGRDALILPRRNLADCNKRCKPFVGDDAWAIPHNSKCRYGERGAADAKPKAQIILDAAKVSAASGGNSEPKQGQRSQSARGFCPRSTMRVPQPDIIEHFGNADAVPQPPKRCLSRKAGIVRCCLNFKRTNRKIRILLPCLAFGIRIFVILLISCTGHVISVQKSL